MYMTSKCMNYSHSKNISVYEDRLKGYEKPVLFEVPNNMKQKEKKLDFKKATALRKINPISPCILYKGKIMQEQSSNLKSLKEVSIKFKKQSMSYKRGTDGGIYRWH